MSIEAMKLALDALGICSVTQEHQWHGFQKVQLAKHALRQAIERAEQAQPVAWMYVNTDGECEQIEYGEPFDDPSVTPLYTFPPPRQPLTDEEVKAIFNSVPTAKCQSYEHWRSLVARAIEVAHGITGESE